MSRATAAVNKLLQHAFDAHSLLFHNLEFHDHTTHHLGALNFLGANDKRIEDIYHRAMVESTAPDIPSPHAITRANWRDSLGDGHFCKAYKDFFAQELQEGNWREKFWEFLLDNESHPLINGAAGGVAHPLIHIGYALELDSRLVAIEALVQTAVCYDYFHEVIDKLQTPKAGTKTPMEIFKAIRADDQLPVFEHSDYYHLEKCARTASDRLLVHFNQWKLSSTLEKTIEDLFDLSVYIYGATHRPNQIVFDFFLLHLLTGMHAVRMIHLHVKDAKVAERVVLQFFYFASVLYVNQRRPEIDETLINDYQVDDALKTWGDVIDQAVNTELGDDAHVVKVIYTLRAAEQAYGRKDGLYFKAAVKTVKNVDMSIMYPEITIPFPWMVEPEDPRQMKMNAL